MKAWIVDQGPSLLLILFIASVCIPQFFCVLADISMSAASSHESISYEYYEPVQPLMVSVVE